MIIDRSFSHPGSGTARGGASARAGAGPRYARRVSPRASAPCLALALAGVACAVACGGAAGPDGRVHSAQRTGPADAAARRALLARVSPSSEAIVAAYEALPTVFELLEGPYTVSSSDTFDGYFRDSAIESVVTYMATGVHEMTHAYAGRMAFQVLAERALPLGDGALALPGDDGPRLVRFTPTFPARELDASFPSELRAFRFGAYIHPATPQLSTQVHGAYGLLDEYAASLAEARAVLDFWPWVRDEAPVDAGVVLQYAVLLDDLQGARAELRLFLLHYVLHARDHHPDVHAGLLGNAELRAAFADVDDRFAAAVDAARALEPEVWALAAGRGVRLDRVDGVLRVDGHPQRADDAARWGAMRAAMDAAPYPEIAASLR